MPTFADVLTLILREVTGHRRTDVQALIDGIATRLGTRSKLQDVITGAEAEALLTQLPEEKDGIRRWLIEGSREMRQFVANS